MVSVDSYVIIDFFFDDVVKMGVDIQQFFYIVDINLVVFVENVKLIGEVGNVGCVKVIFYINWVVFWECYVIYYCQD